LSENWDPSTDSRITIWETAQHLIHSRDKQGETGAAALLRRLGSGGEVARDLAYRLYSTCDRKGWESEALAYSSLVVAWPEISRLASQVATPRQTTIFS
jgi:putative DNA methylase